MRSNRHWKELEARAGALFGGARKWANSGESVDFEGPSYVGQAKLVKRMSLEELTQLAEQAERDGRARNKVGVVAIKVKRGRGRPSPMLLVVTEGMWEAMNGRAQEQCSA